VLAWRDSVGGRIRLAVTDRAGGASIGDFASLNLGGHVGDDPAAVEENRRRVAEEIGVRRERLLFVQQVHGTDVVVADGPWPGGRAPAADGVVTREPDLALAILVADCTPVLLAAPAEGVVGVAHAGRQGMAAGVVRRVVEAMRDLGATELVGRVGPSVCPRCYEVPADLREEVARVQPEARSVSRHGTPSIDVAGGVLAQLAPYCSDLQQLPGCSVERDDLFSHRRDGPRTGRYAGLAWVRPARPS
jgi:YfiH family protein